MEDKNAEHMKMGRPWK